MPIIIGRPNGSSGGSDGTPSPDQEARLASIESVNIEQNTKLDSIQAKDTEQDTQLSSLNSKVDAAVATTTSQAERVSSLEDSYVDYAPTIQAIQTKNTEQDNAITLASGKNEEQDLKIAALESTSTSYNTRMNTIESSLPNKADLVSGKIPFSQLPDLPVGRKVSVANKAARLGLSTHPDLTIAYESDTADAWALDAGEDPAIEANWDKLGNAQATGVQSFNGRTGNVAPQSGDYITDHISETLTRQFISPNDRTRWDDKATVTQVLASTSGLRTEVEAGYIKTSTRGANNGTATLGADGKVPTAQLPPLGLTTTQSQRIDQIESLARLADAKGDSAATNILAVDNRLTQVDNDSKNRDTAQTTRITAVETASASHIPSSQKGVPNGVAPLNANSIVPTVNLPINRTNGVAGLDANGKINTNQLQTNVVGGVPLLDANGRVSVANLPSFLPQTKRIWRDVKASRSVGSWITNNGTGELEVHVRQSLGTTTNRFVSLQVRENASATVFVFNATVLNPIGTSGIGYADSGTITVPGGWQYQVATVGGLTDALIERWYEFY